MTAITKPPALGPVPVCTLCNTPLINYGAHVEEKFFCCRRCAIEVLPTVIADAIGINEASTTRADMVWTLAEGVYWKHIALRVAPVVSLKQGEKP